MVNKIKLLHLWNLHYGGPGPGGVHSLALWAMPLNAWEWGLFPITHSLVPAALVLAPIS